jgi:purine-binding chemotaxis protein CheW
MVDAIHEVVTLNGDCIEPLPQTFVMDTQFVQGIGKMENRLMIIFDIEQISASGMYYA